MEAEFFVARLNFSFLPHLSKCLAVTSGPIGWLVISHLRNVDMIVVLYYK